MVSKTPPKPSSSHSNPSTPYSSLKSKIKNKIKSKNKKKRLSPSSYSSSSHSPFKSIASTLDRSVRSCRRRLIKIFAHLSIFTSQNQNNLGFRRLKSTPTKNLPHLHSPAEANAPLLPPLSTNKKTIFFDLDETLVHSLTEPPTKRYDFAVYPSIAGRIVPFYVVKRPGADELLRAAAEAFEVVVFTAGLKEYASLVLDQLDPCGEFISHRLYREACKEMEGKFVKDLETTGRSLNRAVIVDDNPNAYIYHPENALPVTPFLDDLKDRELTKLMKFFEVADGFEDIRDAVAYYRSEYGDKKDVAC